MLQWHTPALRNDRDAILLAIPVKNEKTIYHQMCLHWNELPLYIRKLDDMISFKKHLKTYYFNRAYAAAEENDSESEIVDNSVTECQG